MTGSGPDPVAMAAAGPPSLFDDPNSRARDRTGVERALPFLDQGIELLAVLAVLFVLQLGLAPFDFSVAAWAPTSVSSGHATASLPDVVGNVALYVPIALLLNRALSQRFRRRAVSDILTLMCAFLLSAFVEFGQCFLPTRVPSWIDVQCNVLGAALGLGLAWVTWRATTRLMTDAILDTHRRPLAIAVKAYAGLLIVGAAMPFTFAVDPPRLKHHLEAAVFVPFGASAHTERFVAAAQARGDTVALAHSRQEELKRWSGWLAEGLSFILLAWLLLPFLEYECRFDAPTRQALNLWIGGGLAVTLSALQFPILSRGFDITDIVFRLAGVLLGAVTCRRLAPWRTEADLGSPQREQAPETGAGGGRLGDASGPLVARYKRWTCLACALTAGYVLYNGLIPPGYSFDADRVGAAFGSEYFPPFAAYAAGRFDRAAADLGAKVSAFAVLATFLAMHGRLEGGMASPIAWKRITAVCVGLSASVEFAQIFNPGRVPTLTDPILAAAGAIVGLLAYAYVARFYAAARALPEHAGTRPEAREVASFGPMDELIASLTEPSTDAPLESEVWPRSPRSP